MDEIAVGIFVDGAGLTVVRAVIERVVNLFEGGAEKFHNLLPRNRGIQGQRHSADNPLPWIGVYPPRKWFAGTKANHGTPVPSSRPISRGLPDSRFSCCTELRPIVRPRKVAGVQASCAVAPELTAARQTSQ